MGKRAQNLDDIDVHAAWMIVLDQGYDPSERVEMQGMKRIKGDETTWEPCILKGPRWAIAMLRSHDQVQKAEAKKKSERHVQEVRSESPWKWEGTDQAEGSSPLDRRATRR